MRVALDRLPPNKADRHAALRDYFCDKDASAEPKPDGWELTLAWPGGAERHVDPRLDEGLTWWGGGVQREDMAHVRHRSGRLLRCLYDSWTLASWAEWLRITDPSALDELVILHVDDHRDLGSPRIFTDGHGWHDLITGQAVDLNDPLTVAAAIESGAIGMGSFMTPFLAFAPNAQVRHLCQPPKAPETQDYRIRVTSTPDTLLKPDAARPSIELEPIRPEEGPGLYRVTPSLDDWLNDVQGRPVLLHIDLDYFCNRYDGDSDWASRSDFFDPPIEEIGRQIEALVSALHDRDIIRNIADAVIAFSPGFFPAEYWSLADGKLAKGLNLDCTSAR